MSTRFLTEQDAERINKILSDYNKTFMELTNTISSLTKKLKELEEKQNQIPEIDESEIIGGYYIPSVDADGDLTWASSKEGMPVIKSTNIKGPEGDKGLPGVSATHRWSGTELTISSASGTSTRDLKGKSAYEYAKEGGYSGSEQEFASKLAALLR